MNIVLLGYRGCGKTTVGRMMAAEMWKTFVDTDEEIVKRFGGRTIKQIWEEFGEQAFRDMEWDVVREVLEKDEQVIALGGGAPIQPVTRKVLEEAENVVRIYLKASAEELHRRIVGDASSGDNRPSLTEQGGGLEEVRNVLAEREPIYEAVADKVFDVTLTPPKDALAYIIKRCL